MKEKTWKIEFFFRNNRFRVDFVALNIFVTIACPVCAYLTSDDLTGRIGRSSTFSSSSFICLYKTAAFFKWALSISVTTARSLIASPLETPMLCCVFTLKIRPRVLSRSRPLCCFDWLFEPWNVLSWCFDWPLLWDSVPLAFCGRGWPHGPAYRSTYHSTSPRRNTRNWPRIKVTGSFVVFPQKCLISDLWPLSFSLLLSLSLNPQSTLFLQFLQESVTVMASTVQLVLMSHHKIVRILENWWLITDDHDHFKFFSLRHSPCCLPTAYQWRHFILYFEKWDQYLCWRSLFTVPVEISWCYSSLLTDRGCKMTDFSLKRRSNVAVTSTL